MELGILGTGKIVREVFPHLCGSGYEGICFLSTEHSLEQTRQLAASCPGFSACAAASKDCGADCHSFIAGDRLSVCWKISILTNYKSCIFFRFYR